MTTRSRLPVRERSFRGEEGSAVIETAVSTVLLFTMIFGIVEMSLALYSYHFVSDAAREGTRYAMVRGSSCNASDAGCPAPASSSTVQSFVLGLGFPGISPGAMTVTTAWPDTGASCTPSASPCNNPGNLVQVTVSYKLPLAIPFVPARTLTMTSTSEMVISQ